MSVHMWSKTGLGWESCVSPGQNFPPKLTEELAAEISVLQGQHSPRVHSREGTWILWGGSINTSGRSHSSEPQAVCTVTSQRSLTHPVRAKPPLHPALMGSCRAVMGTQLSSSSPPVHGCCLESGWPLVLTPSSAAGAEGCGAHPITILCATAATLLRSLKARSKSYFLKNSHLFLVCQLPPPHPL